MTTNGQGRTVSLDQRGLRIDDATVPLVAGTLEYWRVLSLKWRTSLRAMKEAGLVQISSFVCWDFHELDDGSFDFTGRTHPSRDFAGFLDMCAEEGFDFLLRVGPIIDAEWPTRGPAIDVCQLERIDPRYRARTEEYLEALLEHVTPRLATNGGPVVMVAVDNEPYFPYTTDAESDPSEGSMEVPYARAEVLGLYRDWLTDRYGDESGLRRAWRDDSVSLDALPDPDYKHDSTRAVLDSFEFLTDVIADNYVWMRDFCRSRGVDVPIYSNTKPLAQFIGWQQIEQVVDSHGLGVFMSDMLPGNQALVTSWYMRLQRAVTRFPWAAEFQSIAPMGQEKVFGILSDNHQRYMTELSLAVGLRGLSYYVFVERDDGYGSPISPLGKVRPRLEEVKKGVKVAKSVRADRQLYDVGLLWSYEHHRMAIASRFDTWTQLHHVWIGMEQPQELPDWWQTFERLHADDVDFAIVPMSQAEPTKVLIYAGPAEASPAEFEHVVEAVEAGATLIASALPTIATSGEDAQLAELGERLERSGRLVLRDGAPLEELLAAAGVESPISSAGAGLWTTAYEDDDVVRFFVVNPTEAPISAPVRLGGELAERLAGSVASDVETGERIEISDGALLDGASAVPAKYVRAFTVVKKEQP